MWLVGADDDGRTGGASATLPPAQVMAIAERVCSSGLLDDASAGVRRRPVQQRGIETMGLILDAAEALLAEQGLENFSTNSIAERANVNIATLYAYFEDKVAILHELASRDERRRADVMTDLADSYVGGDWRDMLDAVISQLVRARVQHPNGTAVRHAVTTTPELRQLGAQRDERLTLVLADVLRMFRPDLTAEQARRAAAPVIVSASAVLDRAVAGEQVDAELVEGYRAMLLAHLAQVLD